MPTLPLTQLDERPLAADFDNRTFTLTFAQPVPIKDLLLLLVRGTTLSVVPDPAIAGSFIGELKNVTVRQALDLILSAARTRLRRRRQRRPRVQAGARDAHLRHRTTSRPSGRLHRRSAAPACRRPAPRVSSATRTDVFDDLAKGVQTLLTGRASFNVDRKAGLLQVTDFPERLDRVSLYLDAVQDRVHRQVQIDARVIEVEPNDEKAMGVDWTALAAQLTGAATPAQRAAPRRSLTGLRVTDLATADEPRWPSRARS